MKKKKIILPLLLSVFSLLIFASAAGGDSTDPLISRDFLRGGFLGELLSSADSRLDAAEDKILQPVKNDWDDAVAAAQLSAGLERRSKMTEQRLKLRDRLGGTTGLQVLPVAGSLSVSYSSGAVVDATAGKEVPSGAVLASGHRYLVAEDTTAVFSVLSKTAVINYCGPYRFTLSDTPDYNAMAAALKSLHLFRGTDNALGSGYDLEKVPARIQAIIMLIRMLGEESEALSCTGSHPFADVPEWCSRYVAYAYEKGYSNGVGKDSRGKALFGTDMDSSAVQYTEFVLRALGYSTTATTDISDALERARSCGVLTSGEATLLKNSSFLRADVVYLSYYALETARSSDSRPLSSLLTDAGVFTADQYHSAQKTVSTQRIH